MRRTLSADHEIQLCGLRSITMVRKAFDTSSDGFETVIKCRDQRVNKRIIIVYLIVRTQRMLLLRNDAD